MKMIDQDCSFLPKEESVVCHHIDHIEVDGSASTLGVLVLVSEHLIFLVSCSNSVSASFVCLGSQDCFFVVLVHIKCSTWVDLFSQLKSGCFRLASPTYIQSQPNAMPWGQRRRQTMYSKIKPDGLLLLPILPPRGKLTNCSTRTHSCDHRKEWMTLCLQSAQDRASHVPWRTRQATSGVSPSSS